ncbi:hypothetical protein NMY22_g4176 [Coprinellus aureogranulatus]|nr:hypothetical protein NMY22_g4176 [Coprinellus aureogranulatus]
MSTQSVVPYELTAISNSTARDPHILYLYFALGWAAPILLFPNTALSTHWTWVLRWTRTFARDIRRVCEEPSVVDEMKRHPDCYQWALRQMGRMVWVAPEATRRMTREEIDAFDSWAVYAPTMSVDWSDWVGGRSTFNREVLTGNNMEIFHFTAYRHFAGKSKKRKPNTNLRPNAQIPRAVKIQKRCAFRHPTLPILVTPASTPAIVFEISGRPVHVLSPNLRRNGPEIYPVTYNQYKNKQAL